MVVIATKMLSVTSRRKSSRFQSRNWTENLWLCQTFPDNVSAVSAKPHDSVLSWNLFLLFQNLCGQIAVQVQKILVQLCLLHCKSVLQTSKSCTGAQTCQGVEMPSNFFPPSAVSPRHPRSTFLRHSAATFQILKQFLWSPYLWILHAGHRKDDTALGGDCIKIPLLCVLPQPVTAVSCPDALSSRLVSYKLLQLRLVW